MKEDDKSQIQVRVVHRGNELVSRTSRWRPAPNRIRIRNNSLQSHRINILSGIYDLHHESDLAAPNPAPGLRRIERNRSRLLRLTFFRQFRMLGTLVCEIGA